MDQFCSVNTSLLLLLLTWTAEAPPPDDSSPVRVTSSGVHPDPPTVNFRRAPSVPTANTTGPPAPQMTLGAPVRVTSGRIGYQFQPVAVVYSTWSRCLLASTVNTS